MYLYKCTVQNYIDSIQKCTYPAKTDKVTLLLKGLQKKAPGYICSERKLISKSIFQKMLLQNTTFSHGKGTLDALISTQVTSCKAKVFAII